MFRLIKLMIFCGFCFSLYTLWNEKEEVLSKVLSYVLSHPVNIKGIKVDWKGFHIQTLEINRTHSRLYNLSMRAQECTIELSIWDVFKRPIAFKKVSIQDLSLTHCPSGGDAKTLFPKLTIHELKIEKCHVQKKDVNGRTTSNQELTHCVLFEINTQAIMNLLLPTQVAHFPDTYSMITRPKRPTQRAPLQRSVRLSSGCHIIY